MIVMLSEIGGGELFGGYSSTQRHEAHVNKVGAAGTAEVGVGEAVDDVLVIVIARARVPRDHQFRLGTELHHSLRHRGTREGAAAEGTGLVGLRADEGVDVFRVVVGALCAQE